jgi:hypothetical protein
MFSFNAFSTDRSITNASQLALAAHSLERRGQAQATLAKKTEALQESNWTMVLLVVLLFVI